MLEHKQDSASIAAGLLMSRPLQSGPAINTGLAEVSFLNGTLPIIEVLMTSKERKKVQIFCRSTHMRRKVLRMMRLLNKALPE